MEIYTLTPDFLRSQVVEDYESFIWTDRFNTLGDFELVIRSTAANRRRFPIGTRLNHNETHRVMTVGSVEDTVDEQGMATLTLKGYSLEDIFRHRLARESLSDLTTDPKWIIEDYPAEIARYLIYAIVSAWSIDPGDQIPLFPESPGWVHPEDTIPEPPDIITYEIEPQDLYSVLTNLCQAYNMGFRLFREYEFGEPLTYAIYMGVDRTTQQTLYPAVVFSPSLDNMQNTTEFSSVNNYKNVAYVISPVGSEIVYAPEVDSTVSGWDRRAIFVRADDITDVVPADATARMIQRGTEELAKYRPFSGFDGQLSQDSGYIYGGGPHVDIFDTTLKMYNLGDLVELQSASGSKSIMQVTEQIFVSDAQGYRSYPTLTAKTLIVPGSWDAAPPTVAWDDVDPLLVWDDAEGEY